MGSSSKDGAGGVFCCWFRSVRSASRSDLICRISDWISAKKESSLSSLSGLITANLKRQSTFDRAIASIERDVVLLSYHAAPTTVDRPERARMWSQLRG